MLFNLDSFVYVLVLSTSLLAGVRAFHLVFRETVIRWLILYNFLMKTLSFLLTSYLFACVFHAVLTKFLVVMEAVPLLELLLINTMFLICLMLPLSLKIP